MCKKQNRCQIMFACLVKTLDKFRETCYVLYPNNYFYYLPILTPIGWMNAEKVLSKRNSFLDIII